MNWTISQTVDLSRGYTPVVWPDALMVSGDVGAHTWRVKVLDGGVPADLSGAAVTGYFVREDGVTYSLSLRLKCADLLPGKFPSRVLRVMVSGREPSGKSYFGDFLRISGTHDWRRYEVQLVPGLNLPSGLRDIKVGVGNRGGSGTFWVDNLQLEKQPRPTPFTRSARTDPSGGGG